MDSRTSSTGRLAPATIHEHDEDEHKAESSSNGEADDVQRSEIKRASFICHSASSDGGASDSEQSQDQRNVSEKPISGFRTTPDRIDGPMMKPQPIR